MPDLELETLKQELKSFRHAMLVTRRGPSELRSRPMQLAGFDEDGHLWFISSIDSGKVEELTDDPSVNVAMQDGQRFMSVSGVVRITRDRDALREYWHESQRVWFEQGRDDPEVVLLEIIPTYAESWDRSGLTGLKFLFREAQAIVTRDTLTGDEALHEKIPFPATTSSPDDGAR
jgi:general stress protein 26